MKGHSLLVLALIGGIILAACIQPIQPLTPPSAQPGAASNPLASTSWTLTTLNDQPALADVTVTLVFGEESLSGSDGCNAYSAAYTAGMASLTVQGPIVVTMMACSDPIMQQAMAFQTALGRTATYTLAGEQLTLMDASGQSLATCAAQSRALVGTTWEVLYLTNDDQLNRQQLAL